MSAKKGPFQKEGSLITIIFISFFSGEYCFFGGGWQTAGLEFGVNFYLASVGVYKNTP